MIDFVISRGYTDGVLLAGCREHDCHFRLGIEWTQQRLARERDPYLRARVPEERIRTCWTGVSGTQELTDEIESFRQRLKNLQPVKRKNPEIRLQEQNGEKVINA